MVSPLPDLLLFDLYICKLAVAKKKNQHRPEILPLYLHNLHPTEPTNEPESYFEATIRRWKLKITLMQQLYFLRFSKLHSSNSLTTPWIFQATIEEGVIVHGGCSLLRWSNKIDIIEESLHNEEQEPDIHMPEGCIIRLVFNYFFLILFVSLAT